MMWNRQEQRSLFWTGFFAGAMVGGALGALLLSDYGQEARRRVELAADQVRGRSNGRPGSPPVDEDTPEPTEAASGVEDAETSTTT